MALAAPRQNMCHSVYYIVVNVKWLNMVTWPGEYLQQVYIFTNAKKIFLKKTSINKFA